MVRIIQFCRQLDETPWVGRTLAGQLLHSGASIGGKAEEVRETHHWLRLLVLVLVLLHTAVLGAEPSGPSLLGQKVRIGVRAHSGVERAIKKWGATANALSQAVPGYTFELVPLVGFDEMRTAVAKGTIDFVLTNPTAYVELEARFGISRVVTLRNLRTGAGITEFAGVVFTRADRADIETLRDIHGHSIMGVNKEAFGGWWMALRELKDLGIDPFEDCTEVIFSPDGTQESVVYAVMSGEADIGTVRTGIIEGLVKRGELNAGAVKILNRIEDDLLFPHSTRRYPEWPFATLRDTPDELAQSVAITLLSMTTNDPAAVAGGYTGWTIPLDYNRVHDLMRELRVGPYEDYGRVTLGQVFRQHWATILAMAVALILLCLFTAYVVVLNRRLHRAQGDLRNHQEHLEELVYQRSAELRSVFEAADNVAFVTTDLGGENTRVLEFSHGAERIFGYTTGEILGKRVAILHLPDFMEDFPAMQQALREGRKGYSGETTLVRKSGERFPALFTIHPLCDGSGKLIGTLGVSIDITERKRAEEAMRESEEKFRTLVTNIEEIVYMIAKDGTFLLSEGKGLSALGLKPGQVVGKSVFELYKDYPDMLDKVRKAFNGETVTMEENVGGIYFRNWYTPHINSEGEIIGLLGLSVNITERKQTEDELNKYKGHLEELVKERTAELERMNSVFVEREFRIKELKDNIKELEKA